MPGPCTLLVEPHNQTYTDADGVQVLPWHEIAFAKRRLTHAAGVANIQTPAEQWAYSFRTKLSSTPIQMVDAVTAWNATAQAFYTAVSATKTYPHISEVVTWMDANIADIDDQQFWAVLGRFYAHGTGHNGTLSIIKLVSTGGDVTLTLPSNVASSSYGGGAIVLNTSANDRAIRFIANGTETATTIPNTLPAGSYRHVRGSGGAVSIGHALGIKIAGTLADETFYVLQMGFVNESSADPFGPFVHTTGSDIPDTLFFDPNTLNPVDVFAGTNFVSQGRSAESFWRVPITEQHIPDDTSFVVVARTHPVYLPVSRTFSYHWALTRQEEMYDFLPGGVDITLRQRASSAIGDVTAGSTLSIMLTNENFEISSYEDLTGLDNPTQQTEPMTTALVFSGQTFTLRHGETVSETFYVVGEVESGWLNIGNEAYGDLLLVPGAGTDASAAS
jgi:hypothetical protein